MIGRPVIISRELLQADRIIVRPDVDMIVQVIPDARKQVRPDPFKGIHIQPDESITDKYPVAVRSVAPRPPGILRIDGQTYIPAVVPGIVWVPDIGMERDIPLTLEIRAGRKSDGGQIGGFPVAQVKTRRSSSDQGSPPAGNRCAKGQQGIIYSFPILASGLFDMDMGKIRQNTEKVPLPAGVLIFHGAVSRQQRTRGVLGIEVIRDQATAKKNESFHHNR